VPVATQTRTAEVVQGFLPGRLSTSPCSAAIGISDRSCPGLSVPAAGGPDIIGKLVKSGCYWGKTVIFLPPVFVAVGGHSIPDLRLLLLATDFLPP
jgi:hypothetical protein